MMRVFALQFLSSASSVLISSVKKSCIVSLSEFAWRRLAYNPPLLSTATMSVILGLTCLTG